MSPWEGRGAHYLVGEKSAFAGKRVIIVGGGDSACDWVVNLLDTASRSRSSTAARASAPTRSPCARSRRRRRRAGSTCARPTRSARSPATAAIERVTLFHSENEDDLVDVACDAVLLQLGFKTALGPLKEWPLEIHKGAIGSTR